MLPAFLLQLLPLITGAFSQGGQAQLQPIISKPADQIAPFLLNLFSMVAQQTGVIPAGQKIATDEQAVAAVAELQKQKATNAQLVAGIEAHAIGYLADMAPLFDRLMQVDAAENAARREGRQLYHEGEIRDAAGTLLARGRGRFVVVDLERFTRQTAGNVPRKAAGNI